MDAGARQAKLEVGRGVARAYGLRRVPDPPSCEKCDGDGCHWCFWTGDPQKVKQP